ncbi:MAG: chromosome segregation protein SMC [Mesorhizobium sp.]|uniref:ATP-binding protein n=1 Tax=Mesorhizobium sp. TaxID=1871066 RepID=UPI000FE50FCD|nr:AAA family ATPase [Mesorhizobium sp.]RWQ28853.1 MAG: chromosome segregation protein SMC [Mesorhizobium sp.]TIL21991.1 MAG: chromosome segregation protein SMC [Mesorhizobium sp.]
MIRLQKIKIENFRGIRRIELDLKGENFAACGRNGTGKSGIVDAIEFALTGKISRLTGPGTGELSVKQHGPHVDFTAKPELAVVTLAVMTPSGSNATITRSVKAASSPTIEPNTPEIIAALDNARLHPEFVLSRRELIKYVLSEPSSRAAEVQALLRLDDIGKLRSGLQRIVNATAKDVTNSEDAVSASKQQLMNGLGIPELTAEHILDAANSARDVLGLGKLTALEANTALNDGMATSDASTVIAKVSKPQALSDILAVRTAIEKLSGQVSRDRCEACRKATEELTGDSDAFESVNREDFLRKAVENFDGEECPVCETEFDDEAFRSIIEAKLIRYAEMAKKRLELEGQIKPILGDIVNVGISLAAIISLASQLVPPLETPPLSEFKSALGERYLVLNRLLPLNDTLQMLPRAHTVPDLADAVDKIEAAVNALPEPSKQGAARDLLSVAQDRLTTYRNARANLVAKSVQAKRAATAYDVFGKSTEKALEGIYAKVQETFSSLYRDINKEDEGDFTAQLLPSLGKLGFGVDFYGRGQFPPGAYHSEGHQDGMGLCLYLALMSHLQGENFVLAVLDDVLMSVDAGHRREVCTVLKKTFPNTQFIFTTHDEIWLRHMKSEGLIKAKNAVHFRTWTVDHGPKEWGATDVWDEIDAYLLKDDVRGAAALLRHYLEHFSREACHRLRAKVEFRGDAQFMLGDLLPNAVSALGDVFKKSKAAANSWNQQEKVSVIASREAVFNDAKAKAKYDEWQLNSAVHFNEWDNLQKQDFAPVVTSFRTMLGYFSCTTCDEMYGVRPERGAKLESLRCTCGTDELNLQAK